MPKTTLRLLLLALLSGLLLAPGVRDTWAASPTPPDLMSYQGYLVDVNGAPLAPSTPANYPIAFRIYDASTGGTIVWSEQQIVTVDKGNFSVVLGEGTAVSGEARPALSSVFGGASASDRYLGISVTISGTTMTISPRLRLLPSAYAFAATAASKLISNSGQTLLTLANGRLEGTSELTLNPGPLTVTGNASVSGNVGIGTTSPLGALDVNGAIGANSWTYFRGNVNAANPHSSFGSSVGGLAVGWNKSAADGENHILYSSAPGAAPRLVFGSFNGSAISPVMTLKNGNVGIGTTSPETKLHVEGNVFVGGGYGTSVAGSVNTLTIGGGGSSPNSGSFAWGHNGGWKLNFGTPINGTFTPRVTFVDDGSVGIGTTTPIAPLEVRGGAPLTFHLRRYMDSNGASEDYNQIITLTESIVADNRIRAGAFDTFSDSRIKQIAGRTQGATSLNSIRQLQVTDYRYIDHVSRSARPERGFIAQEVEKVLPNAVSQSTDFVPDIYAPAVMSHYDAGSKALTVGLKDPHGLKTDDLVRFMVEGGPKESKVIAVPSATRFVVSAENAADQVFVFGKRVKDFRTVNYEHVFTTGISAIQELDKQVQALKKSEARIAELEQKTARMAELEAKASQVDGLEKRVRELEGVEQQVAELRKLVAELASASRKGSEPVVAAARPQRGDGD